jgi:rhodanese-related sulfurtransferase
MSTTLTPHEISPEHTLIDVRSPREFETQSVPGSVNVPLAELEARCRELGANQNLVLVCASGMRARKAQDVLTAQGINAQVLEGGLKEWTQCGLPVRQGAQGGISIERQVRIVAGFMAALGGFLAIFVHPWFAALSAFVGLGLIFAGVTDTCGMAILLARLPYNANRCDGCCQVPSQQR